MDIKNLLPYDEYKTKRAESMALVKKWDKSGLLEGLDSEREKPQMAVILENQARQLVTEANRTGTDSNSEEWSGVALPLVRRIFGEIAAKDFVSVQPMSLPSGLVFYLDFKYGTSQSGFSTGQGRTSQKDSLFGITDSDRGGAAGTQGLYGSGRFGYSINQVTSSALTSAATLSATRFVSSSANFSSDINYDSQWSASYAGSSLIKIEVSASALPRMDADGVRAFILTGTRLSETFQQFTSYNATQKKVTFIVSGSITIPSVTVHYQVQPTDVTRGDFEDGALSQVGSFGTDMNIPQINLELRSEGIIAKTRKLKAVWTPEFAQDLNAYHSIDAEVELTSMLSEYISMEIDLEILDMLIENAQTTDYWSARIGYEWDGTSAFSPTAANVAAYNQGTWFQTLGTKIQKVSNTIHKLTMRGGANFIVTSPTIATVLESIPGYAADTDGDKMQFAMGVQKVGMLNSRYQVYKNPYITENILLLGYRGSQFLETGAVYAPYVPLIMTPLVYDPDNFTPRKGIETRYAKKITRPEFYGKIYVADLNRI